MKKLLYTFFLIGCMSTFAWGAYTLYKTIQFGIHCESFLRRSIDAPNVDIAKTQLCLAINYCEAQRLTSGSTSLLYSTDDENVGLWYKKLKTSFILLNLVPNHASQLEQNTALLRLRRTLLITDKSGQTSICYPQGISLYPYNLEYALWGCFSLIILIGAKLISFARYTDHWNN